jgi:hypothetical protein
MDKINERLDELIMNEIDEISTMNNGDEKSKSIEGLTKLYKVRADQEKNRNDFDAKIREIELREKEADMAPGREDRNQKIGLIVEAVEFTVPLAVYIALYCTGLKFEEHGVFKSPTFRGLTSKMRPFKKWW